MWPRPPSQLSTMTHLSRTAVTELLAAGDDPGPAMFQSPSQKSRAQLSGFVEHAPVGAAPREDRSASSPDRCYCRPTQGCTDSAAATTEPGRPKSAAACGNPECRSRKSAIPRSRLPDGGCERKNRGEAFQEETGMNPGKMAAATPPDACDAPACRRRQGYSRSS